MADNREASLEKRLPPDFKLIYLEGEGGTRVAWHWDRPGASVDIARQGFSGLHEQFSGRTLISTNFGQLLIARGMLYDVPESQRRGEPTGVPIEDAWRTNLVIPIAGRWSIGDSPTVSVYSVMIDTERVQSRPPGGQAMVDVFAAAVETMHRRYDPGSHDSAETIERKKVVGYDLPADDVVDLAVTGEFL